MAAVSSTPLGSSTPSSSSSSAVPNLIDPTKQAEYPILLSERLKGDSQTSSAATGPQLFSITYNHKPKLSPSQRAKVTATSASDASAPYTLKLQSSESESGQTYVYQGSHDPKTIPSSQPSGQEQGQAGRSETDSKTNNLVLIFDSRRKAFVLDQINAKLNFNLVSAPGKTEAQVRKLYDHLPLNQTDGAADTSTQSQLQGGDGASLVDGEGEDEDADTKDADEGNPYDWRHFLNYEKEKEKEKGGGAGFASPAKSFTSNRSRDLGTPVPDLGSELSPLHLPSHEGGAARGKSAATTATTAKAGTKAAGRATAKTKAAANPLRTQQPKKKQPAKGKAAGGAKAKSADVVKEGDEGDEAANQDVIIFPSTASAPRAKTEKKEDGGERESGRGKMEKEEEEDKEKVNLSVPSATNTTAADRTPSSNIIDYGGLVVDMGSPPPERTPVKIDHTEFGLRGDDEDEEEEHVGLPGILRRQRQQQELQQQQQRGIGYGEEDEEGDDEDEEEEGEERGGGGNEGEEELDLEDELEADMEAAFKEEFGRDDGGADTQHQQHTHGTFEEDSEESEEE